ncbi:MAG: hypothetical protein HQL20_09855 [Candidatus Omnitrophica bacterium]|nr:hypothetical protein [Candidatus Omnitrophota bacterium]
MLTNCLKLFFVPVFFLVTLLCCRSVEVFSARREAAGAGVLVLFSERGHDHSARGCSCSSAAALLSSARSFSSPLARLGAGNGPMDLGPLSAVVLIARSTDVLFLSLAPAYPAGAPLYIQYRALLL